MAPGQSGLVARVDVRPPAGSRLMELGLTAGTPVEIVRYAPLGDPVEIRLRGYHLTLRRHEAEQILVQLSAHD